MPSHFLGDVVLTACLINLMPSSVLNHQVLYITLFSISPLYQVYPRALYLFCSWPFSWSNQCYFHVTHHEYTSVDATFFEETSYFNSFIEPNVISKVLPVPYFGLSLSSLQVLSMKPFESHSTLIVRIHLNSAASPINVAHELAFLDLVNHVLFQ